MNIHLTSPYRRTPLAVAAAVLCFATASTAVGSQFSPMYFTGGGYGPTTDVAIQSAIWDAEATASIYQLYNCQLVGEILIFPGSNPARGRTFAAEATLACTM